ncbi:MAG: hypothetical protein JXB05_01330 [Myxococcaceae bacterium]|nr:hypothetical protein [Myxococcaceae bacterium]
MLDQNNYASSNFMAACEDFKSAAEAEPTHALLERSALWAIHAMLGDEAQIPEEFRKETQFFVASSPRLFSKAALHAVEGKHDVALDLLVQCVRDAPAVAVEARLLPQFHSLREHPRFVELTSRTFD